MSKHRKFLPFLLLLFVFGSIQAFAQKAEPLRIKFAKGKTAATVSNTLSNGEEMDFVFGARAGQSISLKVTSSPKGNFFDFSLMGDGFEFTTEQDYYDEYSYTAPETGDYLVTVRKRAVDSVPEAKFYLTLTIR